MYSRGLGRSHISCWDIKVLLNEILSRRKTINFFGIKFTLSSSLWQAQRFYLPGNLIFQIFIHISRSLSKYIWLYNCNLKKFVALNVVLINVQFSKMISMVSFRSKPKKNDEININQIALWIVFKRTRLAYWVVSRLPSLIGKQNFRKNFRNNFRNNFQKNFWK